MTVALLAMRLPREQRAAADTPTPAAVADMLDTRSAALAQRPVVRYSVIPGGTYDMREVVHAAASDPVVARHYADVDLTTLRAEILKENRWAYVSYRKGDRVYWTKHKVPLRSGETILTNGATEIRGRCGNRISLEPLFPTSDSEPDALELEALLDEAPLTSLAMNTFAGAMPPLIQASGGIAGPTPASLDQGRLLGNTGQGLGLIPLGAFPVGISTSRSAGSNVPLPDDSLESPIAPVYDDPSEFSPPDLPVDRDDRPGVQDDGVSDDGVPNDGVPESPGVKVEFSPRLREQPKSVPEPGTLLLVGAGIAGFVMRRLRS